MLRQTDPQRMNDIRPIGVKPPAMQDHRRTTRGRRHAVRLNGEKVYARNGAQLDWLPIEQAIDDLILQALLSRPVGQAARNIGADRAAASDTEHQQHTDDNSEPRGRCHRRTPLRQRARSIPKPFRHAGKTAQGQRFPIEIKQLGPFPHW